MAGKSEPGGLYLRLPVDYSVITGLVYMPDVDAIIVSTAEGSLLVYDAASFKRLFERKIGEGSLSCLYHCHSGRLVVTNRERLGARSARRGLLYLPTILQTTVSPEEEVVLEVPHEEAIGLLDCLRATTELGKWISVRDSSKEQLLASLESTSSDLTARQQPHAVKPEWKFVDVHGTPSLLRVALTPSIPQGKVLQIPICHELLARELVLDREGDGEKIYQIEAGRMGVEFLTSLPTSLHNMEALRKLSLVEWPLKDHRWATPSTLAAAGFHKSSKQDSMGWYVGGDNDLVTCFNCFKSLRSWEPCDEPWSEHTRHFPECSFITGQRTANVPLSVTMASTPATMLTHQDVAEEPPILSTSWGCPFVGVAWKNGTIVVYNVGHSFFLHQHCEVFRLSAEALMASLQFEETVSGERDGSMADCPQGGVLEKALDGIKVAIADLHDMESTMTSDASGSTGGGGPSVVVSACCVLQSSGCGGAAVEPAVVIGCSLVLPEEARPMLVAYTLQGRKVDKVATAFPATASLAQIVPVPTVGETEGQSVTPAVTDIVPCAGGRFLAVNVVYRETKGQEATGSTVQSAANDEGCSREADGAAIGGDGGNSSSHNITCSQTLLFEVAEETGAKSLSPPRPTSLSQSPVVCKVSQEPGTRLVSLAEARRGGSKKVVHLLGVTVDGQVLELTGEKLHCRVVVSAGCDPVVLCAPCIGLDQLVVVRQSSLMELVRLSRVRALASEEGGEGAEELDCSPGAEKDGRSEEERLRSELSVESVKAIHSAVTRIGEEGLPFMSWVPVNWREISTEQKDRNLPQHVHHPTEWGKDKGKKMWMIPWRTDTLQSPLMVMELAKPQGGSIAQLNVQLQSEVTASLVSLSVSLLAVTEPSRSTEGEKGIERRECGSGGETARVVQGTGTGGVSFSETVSDAVDDLCRRSSSVCVCGPVKCADCLGITQDEVTLALYHRSLQEPHVRKYLLVLEVCLGANVERATPLPGSKGKENVILSVAFLPSKVPLSLDETSHLGFVLGKPAFVQLLLVLAAGGKVLREEFGQLCVGVKHFVRDHQHVEDVGEEPDGVRYSAMEVLCYIAGREVHQTVRSNCRVLLATVSPVLGTLLYSCVLHGTRNLAYRTSRFLRLCLRLARAIRKDAGGRESLFSPALHRALLENLPLVPSASCAVGVRCFCDLLGALEGTKELVGTVQGLLQVCGRMMDFVGNLSVAPVLHGMAAAETSVINLNFDPFMFDGGLPSLLCVSAESSSNKPSLEYSSINHNNEMKLFCNGGATPTDHSATGGKSFVTVLNSTDGNTSKGSNELICSSMKMAPFLRQSQAGALDSFEIAYTVKSFSHCEPLQSMKQGAKDTLGPYPSLKSRNYLLRALLRQGCGGSRATDLEGAAVPWELIEKIASKEPVDASTAKAHVTCLEESLFGNFDVSGRKVEVASARSGQWFSVILDFHLPILLTDVCIPTNALLNSVTVDVWLAEGEPPSRVLHAKDLSCKSVSLGNLSPPPLCQFAKVTFAVGTGKSSPSLVADLGLYCGQLVLPLLTPFVLHRLSQLTKQLQGHFAAVTEQLNAVLEYMVKAPPTAGDPVAMEMINLTKQMTRDAGSLQFTVSILESMWSHAASQHLGSATEPPDGATEPPDCATEPPDGATEPPDGATEPPDDATEPPGGATEPPDGATEPSDGLMESSDGATEQTGQREYLIDPKSSTRVDLTLPVPCNQWFSVARRLINKLTCLLARLKRAGFPSPCNTLTRQQAKNMFFALGLQCYAKVSARAMSILVENCAGSPWWPGLIQEIIQEVTCDQRPLLYDKERAFALLSGFIRRTSSTEIVGCLLCLLEQQFGSCQEEGDSAPVSTQERIAKYHWLLTVFCDAISSLGLLAKISDLLPRERCCMVSKGIVTFIMKLVASSNPSSGQTVLVCCKAILLLCKTSSPALTLSDVFGEESLLEYLIVCCKNWGGATGEGQSSTVWLTAMESVVLEIFQMECVNAEAVISSRPVDSDDSRWSDEPVKPVITQASCQDSQTPPEASGKTGKNPTYNSEESDDEFIGYLAKKAGIDTTASYFTEEQHWPSKHMLHRYSRRKRTKTKDPPPPNDTDDPPYSTYIVSGCVDHRLGASFELLAENDMQLAWKEEYRDTLHCVASCGCAPLAPDVRKAEAVPASDPCTVLTGLKSSQALLCTVLIRLAGRCSGPFSELSSVALVRLWWTVTQLTLFCKDKDIPSEAVSKSLFLLDQFLQFQAGGGQRGVGDSKPAAADPAEVMSLSQLTCQLGFLPHIMQLISSSSEEADGLMQGLKLVTAILSAQVVLSSRYGTSRLDACTSIDLEPLGTTLSRLFRNQISHGKLQIMEEFIEQLLKYYEEGPAVEEEEESTKTLKCSGMLVVVERVAHFLSITEPQEALQSRALVSVIRQLLEFYQRASEEGAGQECQRGEQERRIMHAVYCSKELERFKVAMKSLFESVMRAMLFHYGESGRERLTMYTQDIAMRRFHDPSRSSWTETPKAKSQMSHTVASMCGMMNHLVQWESKDNAKGVWEDLTRADAFIDVLLQVYLLCVSSKLEVEAGRGPSVLECVKRLVQQISTSRLVQPITALLQQCGRDQVALLARVLELIECISSWDGGEVFMELLLGRRALEAAVEGFLDSCVHHLPSEPSLLKLPYIWHLFRANGNEEMQNLSEFVLEPSHRVKLLLKGGRMRLAEGVLGVEPIVICFKQPVIVHNIQLLNSMHPNGPQAVEVVAKTMEYSPAMSVTGVVQNPGGDSIKLELHSLPLVTELRIFMWRTHSANDIFLSGIVIIGQPFLSHPHTKVPTTAGPSNSWLLFLHWWLQQKSEKVRSEVERNLGAQCVPLARGCLRLLTVGADPTVLRLLVHLAGLSDDLSSTLVHGLLSSDRVGQFDPLLLRSISQEATMELLKLLCMPDTGPGMQRLDLMLQLSVELSQAPLDRQPRPLLLKYLASLVWQFQTRPIATLQDIDRTRALANFAFHLPMDSPLKVAYNALLCALCAHSLGHTLRRDLFEVAQKQFGAEAFTTNSSGVVVNEGFLSTLAALLQSRPAMEHFLQSNLADMVLLQLNQSLQELQTALSTASPWQQPATQHSLESVQLLLVFVSSLAARMQLAKEWLGREGAAQTWTLLLTTATSTAQPGSTVEQKYFTDLTFEFFARCCEHYPANKTLLALLLKDQMESFTRDAAMVSPLHHRLLTSVVLGVDRIPVVIQVEHRNGNGTENTPSPPLPLLLSHHAPEYHPSLGGGGAAYVSFLPTTMLVDTLLTSFSQASGQPVSEKAASKTSASITATALEMHNLDFSAVPDPPECIVMPSPLQVVNWHTSTLKKLPRMRRRDTVPKPSSTPTSSSCQLGLRPLGKSPLFVPLACLTVGDLLRALDEAGLGENNPLALRLVYRLSVPPVQDASENGTMDPTVKHLASSLQQCFRKKTKPSSCHVQPTAEGTPPHPPSPSLPHPPLGSILRLQMKTGLLEIVAAILPQLYGSLWPRVAGMARAEHEGGSSVDDGLIASPPSGVPFHSVVMLGLGMGLSEVCVQLMSDTSMDALVMLKVVLGGNLSDVLSELNYTPANKKKFACLPYQIVEQVLCKGEPDQGLVEAVPCEGEPDQGLVEEVPCEGEPDQGLVEAVSCEGEPDQGLVEAVSCEGEPDQGLVEAVSCEGEPDQGLVEEVPCEGEPDQGLVEEVPCEGEPDQGLVEVVPCEGEPDQGLVEVVPCEGEPDQGLVEVVPCEGEPDQGLVEEVPCEGEPDQGLVEEVPCEGEPDQGLVEAVPCEGKLDQGLVEEVPCEGEPDQGLVERCFAVGVLHHVLGCLRHLGSHSPRDKSKDATVPYSCIFQSSNGGADLSAMGSGQKFFAKGTGFGSGSLRSGWDMEQVRETQKEVEQQVECCLKIFAAFMNGVTASAALWERHPSSLHDIVASSALLPALASYLFNDSVLDMAQHVPLYLAVFAVVRSLSRQPHVVGLLLEGPFPGEAKEPADSIYSLMEKMKATADRYRKAARLSRRVVPLPLCPGPSTEDKDGSLLPLPSDMDPLPPLLPKGLQPKTTTLEEEVSDGVLQLMQAIESSWAVLQDAVAALRSQQSWEAQCEAVEERTQKTAGEVYMETMRPLQFDSTEMTTVGEDGKIACLVPYHYAGHLESVTEPVGGARAMRITQEITTLANSLPLSASSSVFIRCDEERVDVMKVLITGPADTPYANGCFVFDVFFPGGYPNHPMLVNLQTTGHRTVRFNPNLYADGKVCLSVLNTWSGRPEEKWNSRTSSLLQVLVSIQSLILVAEPYFNEPGYERQRGTPQGDDQNLVYNAVVFTESVRWAILEQIVNPAEPFRQVILQHFHLKQHEVLRQCREWRRVFAEAAENKKHLTTVSAKLRILDSLLPQLERKLAELKPDQFQTNTSST